MHASHVDRQNPCRWIPGVRWGGAIGLWVVSLLLRPDIGLAQCTWSGTFQTTFDLTMTLSEASGQVSGSYTFNNGASSGTISGTVRTEFPGYTVLDGDWREPHEGGRLWFTMPLDPCTQFTGQYTSDAAPDQWIAGWDGTRTSGGGGTTGPFSSDQQAFVNARGLPPQFVILFATETLDPAGVRGPLAAPRRLETWFYNLGQLRAALFDNGFFVKEDVLGPSAPLTPTPLSPAQFRPGLTRSEVEALLGLPSCEQSVALGGEQLVALRYQGSASTPVHSAVLSNGVIASVAAGFAIQPDGSASTAVCL